MGGIIVRETHSLAAHGSPQAVAIFACFLAALGAFSPMADSWTNRARRFFTGPARFGDRLGKQFQQRSETPSRRHVGNDGEEAATRHLQGRGWHILNRNWRPEGAFHGLELDIVARDGDTLVFVEVKTRSVSGSATCTPHGEAAGQEPLSGPEKAKDTNDVPRGTSGRHADDIPVLAAFTPRKRQNLLRAARQYLAVTETWDIPCRFDLLCLRQEPDGTFQLDHYEHVIEAGQALDSGDASWQPW